MGLRKLLRIRDAPADPEDTGLREHRRMGVLCSVATRREAGGALVAQGVEYMGHSDGQGRATAHAGGNEGGSADMVREGLLAIARDDAC